MMNAKIKFRNNGVLYYLYFIAFISINVCTAQTTTKIALKQIGSGLGKITDIQNPGIDNRLFVVDKAGIIRALQLNGNIDGSVIVSDKPFLDISTFVIDAGERGLLGLAFHPKYADNGYFFVNYSCDNTIAPSSFCPNIGDTIIARYARSSTDPDLADINSALIVATISQPFSNHNGGQLQFERSTGYLFIGTGDGGRSNDPQSRAQDMDSLLGKMLRVDVESMNIDPDAALPRWKIPPDNPFKDEIWAVGLRNPWRYSFDQLTGDMFIGDVGQGKVEEIDLLPSNSTGGLNFGWRQCEGTRTNFEDEIPNKCSCEDESCWTPPILEYTHAIGASVTGGYVYRGPNQNLYGIYFYADYAASKLWGARLNGKWKNVIDQYTTLSGISTFGEDSKGNLYIGTIQGALVLITTPLYVLPIGSLCASDSDCATDSCLPTILGNKYCTCNVQNNGGCNLNDNEVCMYDPQGPVDTLPNCLQKSNEVCSETLLECTENSNNFCVTSCGVGYTCDWRQNLCNKYIKEGLEARAKGLCRNGLGGIRRCGPPRKK